jgi:hypothetical protein
MIIQSLLALFIAAFIAIAILGHVLVLRAALTPTKTSHSSKADEQPSFHAPVTATRIAA